jgi:hypothetical protein
VQHEVETSRLAQLRAMAEEEMRRRLPPTDGEPDAKRQKTGGASGGRFDYGAIKELSSPGITGFLLTCRLQR